MSRYGLFKAAFETLSALRLPPLIRTFSACRGVIFTLHRVLPEPPAAFAPNAILQITPGFLEAVILKARAAGFDIVSMDTAIARLQEPDARPFTVLTFDDAYRDNLVHALPILRKYNVPFTLYVPTALVDGAGEVWWQALEDIVAGGSGTLEEKYERYNALYWHYRKIPEAQRVEEMSALARENGLDLAAHCRSLIMGWDELQTFADESLCTIGAHTIHHFELSKLDEAEARWEMAGSADILKTRFGTRPRHFSYPIGSRQAAGEREYRLASKAGFESAVTTIPGGLYPAHGQGLHVLPRISLNGNFQNERYIDVLLTGALFTQIAKLDKGPRQ
ncbi:polysaccharide deacetylase family protein [Pelagibacterium sediminicola]|uniref:polysaccharide deacetylase family protein n=1 Tax=Pelagibacterium sediminicola TaxID=2248761 RepID=UPI000E318936|nr:polysaccharide deacetylase family protein [Pelagibacterium sediminicola]